MSPDPALTEAISKLIWEYETYGCSEGPLEVKIAEALESGVLAEHGYPGRMERSITPTDVGKTGDVEYCLSHDSPGVWFSDGSGGCMLEQILETDLGEHESVPLFRLARRDGT